MNSHGTFSGSTHYWVNIFSLTLKYNTGMAYFKIHHVTKYEYDRQIKESINEIKIFPHNSQQQEVLQHDLFITGYPYVQTFEDYWGNKTGSFNVLAPHKELIIESRLVVRT